MITLSTCCSPLIAGTCGSESFFSDKAVSITADHLDNLAHQRELEAAFCKDFVCCNTQLLDLHDLLQHYEEHHVQCEEEEYYQSTLSPGVYPDGDTWTYCTIDPVTCLQPLPTSTRTSRSPSLSSVQSSMSGGSDSSVLSASDWFPSPYKSSAFIKAMEAINIPLGELTEDETHNRPYKCNVAGCDKAYKNANGLKYHKAHGRCLERLEDEIGGNTKKPFQCAIGACRKRYKNLNGLKYHIEHAHMTKLRQQYQR